MSELIPLRHIMSGKRIREDYGDPKEWKQFKESLTKDGQLQAITIEQVPGDSQYIVRYGDRRFRAITELNKDGIEIPNLPAGHIRAEIAPPVPEHTKLIREFSENIHRKDFTYIEKAKFIRTFHETMAASHPEVWTQELTAHSLHLHPSSISLYLRIEDEVKKDEGVGKAKTMDAAIKRIRVKDKIKKRIDEASAEDIHRAEKILQLGDARDLIKLVADESQDFVNFDPPFGGDVAHKSQENYESFDDTEAYAKVIRESLLPEIFRILKPDRFCAFWYANWRQNEMVDIALAYGFNLQFTRTPFIWYKVDKKDDQNRVPEKQPIDAYETFLLLRKGDPIFHERLPNNVLPFERVLLGSLIHPTEKPVPLCESLLRMCTVPGERIFDPTAGSSAMLEAALRNSRKAGGIELKPTYYERGISRLADYLKTFKES